MTNQTQQEKLIMDFVSLLKVYQVYDEKGLIQLRRIGKDNDGGYIIPEEALKQSDVIIGYGISNDSSFEESASKIYNKRSYGLDGTGNAISNLNQIKHKLFHFAPICIISESQMKTYNGIPTISSSFHEHIRIFNLEGKKIFIKMDIEGSEYTTIPDILEHSNDITGIVFELHIENGKTFSDAFNLLKQLERDFILLHLHGNNPSGTFSAPNAKGNIPIVLELTYINKSLTHKSIISPNQSHPTELDMPNTKGLPDAKFEICL